MPILDIKSLNNHLKSKKFANLYYCYGSDIFQAEQSTKKIIKALTGGEMESVTKFDGTNLDVSTLADEAELCPMFAEYNCIWIHDFNMESVREDIRKAVKNIVDNVSEQTILIFDVTGFDIYGGKTGKNKKPTAKNKTLIDAIAKKGIVCCTEPKTVSQTASELMATAKKKGCTMEKPAAVTLAEQCNCQSLLLTQEMEKLCAYADGSEITLQMVQELVTPQLETTVYALTNAVLRHKANDAMKAVEELLAMRVEMPYLMATVSGSMLDVQRAVCAKQSGKTVDDVMSDFSYKMRFAVENAFRNSMGENMEHLTRCLCLLRDAEQQMYSGTGDERVIFEKTIVEMLRR